MEGTAVRGQIKVYTPKSSGKKAGVVGFPGFATAHDEEGRIDTVLKALAGRDIVGIKFTHSTVRREGNVIIAPFDLSDYVSEYVEAIEYAAAHDDIDRERVGVIASSMSGAIMAHVLAREYREGRKTEVPIRCIAFTAPVSGWKSLYNEETREQLLRIACRRPESYMEITTTEDKARGISRRIPYRDMGNFQRLDALSVLDGGMTNPEIRILTIGGEKDETVNHEFFGPFHDKLGGEPGDLKIYPGQPHHIDPKVYMDVILNFMTTHLQQ